MVPGRIYVYYFLPKYIYFDKMIKRTSDIWRTFCSKMGYESKERKMQGNSVKWKMWQEKYARTKNMLHFKLLT